ncbi:MAG: hypothetical protein WBD36_08065 [Bacteroidota bacterium]
MICSRIAPYGLLIPLGGLLAGCSSSLELQSVWPADQIKVDGVASEWPGKVWVEKSDVQFGIANDSTDLYVAIVASKAELRRQITVRGLTVWFDPLGRQKKSIGIRYPLPRMRRAAADNPDEQPEAQLGPMAEFEYLTPLEPDPLRVPVVAARGIQLQLKTGEHSLVYELKIPIRASSDHPYTLESSPGSTIAVCLEIGGFDQGAMRERGEGLEESGRGGIGGRRGGMRGESGGQRGSNAFTPMKPVEIWSTVQLASGAK